MYGVPVRTLSPAANDSDLVGRHRCGWVRGRTAAVGEALRGRSSIVARTPLDLDELVERWTLLKDEQVLVSGKRSATRLCFAVLLKFSTQYGRFPRNRTGLPGEAVEFVALKYRFPHRSWSPTTGRAARSSTTVRRSGSTLVSGSPASRTRRS
ncbi:DUF4158 domain-containing protein [Streptomyces sp. NPDC017991]|uniref:DUF4158 domain-containing protein n=1 Tax=Streptomyces sp. NPDC017991 TaxID=3365026 RepID=UPI00379646B3